ncbi:MAG: tetratricopeptide repeat protein, partial [Betaproteobacteria bacterium]
GRELDAIIAKATVHDPAARYDAVGALQHDLRRLRAHEPVQALPQTAAYVAAKLLRRRWPWVTAGAAALLMAAGFTVRVVQERDRAVAAEAQARSAAEQAQRAEVQARADQARAERASREAQQQRDRAQLAEAQATEQRDLARRESLRARAELDTSAELSRYLMSLFTGADPKLAGVPDLPRTAITAEGQQRLAEVLRSETALRARLQVARGDALERVGRADEAIAAYADAAAVYASRAIAAPLQEADAQRRLALVLSNSGQAARAEAPARRALDLLERHDPRNMQAIADAENRLGVVLTSLRRFDEAQRRLERALRRRVQGQGAESPNSTVTASNLARMYSMKGDAPRADAEFRRLIAIQGRVIGPADPRDLIARELHGGVLSTLQRHDEAVRTLREVLAGWERAFGPDNSNATIARQRLGRALVEAGRFGEGIAELEAIFARNERANADDRGLATTHEDLAVAHDAAGRIDTAASHWRRASKLGGGSRWAFAEEGWTRNRLAAGRADEARPLADRVLAARDGVLAATDPLWLRAQLLDTEVLIEEQPPARAGARLDAVEPRLPVTLPGLRARAMQLRGRAAARNGEVVQAARLLKTAWQMHLQWRGGPHPALLEPGLEARAALLAAGQPAAAAALDDILATSAQAHDPQSPWRRQWALLPGEAAASLPPR